MEVLEQIDPRLYPIFARTFQHLTLELGLYRLYFFFVIRHLPTHYRAHLKVSTKPGQDDKAATQLRFL
jgi:hypothetical protein